MPSITKRKNGDGTTSFLAQARVQGFKPSAKTFGDRKAAERWAKETEALLRGQRERSEGRPDLAVLTVGELILEYLRDPETVALKTFDDTHRLLCWFVQEVGTMRALDLNVLRLRELRTKLSKGREPATVNRYLGAARSCWNFGRSAGLIPRDHLWPERLMLSEPAGRTRFLNDEELTKLKKAAREHSPLMNATVIVSLATGIRQGELLRLDWSDIDMVRKTLRVRLSKNGEQRSVFLPDAAITALKELQGGKVRNITGAVFIRDGKRLVKSTLECYWRKTIRKNAGLEDFRWHDLRHSCASFLAQQGATLVQIGAQLGHKSPAMTARYSHLVEGAPLPAHAALNSKLA